MTQTKIRQLLEQVAAGQGSAAPALKRLRPLPVWGLGFARLDTHPKFCRGGSEVFFCAGKSAPRNIKNGGQKSAAGLNLMVTRLAPDKAAAVKRRLRKFDYRPEARIGVLLRDKPVARGHGAIIVVSAGTSDIPVAEEAAVSAEFFGNRVERLYDVGVAGVLAVKSRPHNVPGGRLDVGCVGEEGWMAARGGWGRWRSGHARTS